MFIRLNLYGLRKLLKKKKRQNKQLLFIQSHQDGE